MSYQTKVRFGNKHALAGKSARTLGVSLFPHHTEVLRLREQQLNIHRSVIIQTLIDLEERHGLVRRELSERLAGAGSEGSGNGGSLPAQPKGDA